MSGQERKTGKRVLNVGLLAHVDAGKTTLSESILYQSGAIRNLGRVDHQDAFLDTDEMERERGITIFSKQAVLTWKDTEITLLDTPGGDGAGTAGAGLCGAGDQRGRRCAGTYGDFVETFNKIRNTGVPFCE